MCNDEASAWFLRAVGVVAGHVLDTGGPKTDLEAAFGIAELGQIPGPGAYDNGKAHNTGGGRFNRGNAKSQLEWEIYRAKQVRRTPRTPTCAPCRQGETDLLGCSCRGRGSTRCRSLESTAGPGPKEARSLG